MSPGWALCAGLAAMGLLWCGPAHAEVTVSGEASDLTVEADAADVEDIILAVADAIDSTIEPPDELPDALVTGVYRGSVAEVLKALMPSADFIVAWRDGTVDVHFIAEGRRPAVARASPAEPDEPEQADASADDDDADDEPGRPGNGDRPPEPARRVY